jgi:hypothetical protein
LPALEVGGADASSRRLQSIRVRGTRQRRSATARSGIGGDQIRGGDREPELGRADVGVDVEEVDQAGAAAGWSKLGGVVFGEVGGAGGAVRDLDQQRRSRSVAGVGAADHGDVDDVGDRRRQGHRATLP